MSTATAEKTQPTEVKGIGTKDIDNYIKKNLEKRDLEAKLRDLKEQLEQEEQRLTEYFAENGLQNVKTKSGLAYLSRGALRQPRQGRGRLPQEGPHRPQEGWPQVPRQGPSQLIVPPGLRPGAR